MAKLNWERTERDRRMNYRPRPGARPASPRQIEFINSLAAQKGRPRPTPPKTMRGASEIIEQLLALPDTTVAAPIPERPEPSPEFTERQQVVKELREVFPQLSPMMANSLIQMIDPIVDPIETALFVNELIDMSEYAPTNLKGLVQWLFRRFLEFSAV